MYTHLKVDVSDKDKFRKLAANHKLTMLQLFHVLIDKEYTKQFKDV